MLQLDGLTASGTTDAFPLRFYDLDIAGINRCFQGINPKEVIRKRFLEMDLPDALGASRCDRQLTACMALDKQACIKPF